MGWGPIRTVEQQPSRLGAPGSAQKLPCLAWAQPQGSLWLTPGLWGQLQLEPLRNVLPAALSLHPAAVPDSLAASSLPTSALTPSWNRPDSALSWACPAPPTHFPTPPRESLLNKTSVRSFSA